mmetsp:Transcript_6792/g.17588  ORF Transcript_6792/g.17588 Transcript_6792/m.17588 type:complete len:218 (-) Transcript_6792:4340-4993(-)
MRTFDVCSELLHPDLLTKRPAHARHGGAPVVSPGPGCTRRLSDGPRHVAGRLQHVFGVGRRDLSLQWPPAHTGPADSGAPHGCPASGVLLAGSAHQPGPGPELLLRQPTSRMESTDKLGGHQPGVQRALWTPAGAVEHSFKDGNHGSRGKLAHREDPLRVGRADWRPQHGAGQQLPGRTRSSSNHVYQRGAAAKQHLFGAAPTACWRPKGDGGAACD